MGITQADLDEIAATITAELAGGQRDRI